MALALAIMVFTAGVLFTDGALATPAALFGTIADWHSVVMLEMQSVLLT